MKKVKVSKGLSLHKETVTRLSDSKMASVKGGALTNYFCSGGKNTLRCASKSVMFCRSYDNCHDR